jgi:HK97 family phage major capsid protein
MNDTESKLVTAMSGLVSIQKFLVGLPDRETIGQQIIKTDQFQKFAERKSDYCKVELKTSILATGLASDPLTSSYKPAVAPTARRSLTLLDVIPTSPTTSAMIEMPVAAVTNNAAGQYGNSPEQAQDVAIAESAMAFTNTAEPVVDYAHMVPISSNVWEDSNVLNTFAQTEMIYGLRAAIENGVLNATGGVGRLNGLLGVATSYAERSPKVSGEAARVRDAIRQVNAANFSASVIVLNPADTYSIDAAIGADGSNRLIGDLRLWGLPIVETTSIAAGSFLVMDSARAAILFERTPVQVEFARFDSENFQKGMITVKAQQRIALVTCNSLAMVTGTL